MPKAAHKVVVIGHRNPDTDSICSAIAYAELKNKTSDLVCEARRAGKMNQETEFVLKKFGVTPPRMCTAGVKGAEHGGLLLFDTFLYTIYCISTVSAV